MKVTIVAPAKINLWLRVGALEPSGYHRISTLFCALDLSDTVILREAGSSQEPILRAEFAPPLDALPDLGPDETNLAARAAAAFQKRADMGQMPQIRLIKRIPSGAGLGGGSSDAGAVLRALRRLHPGVLPAEEVPELAAGLGSDVPFFVLGSPLALGTGRGERLTALAPPPPRPVVLVIPPFPVATGDAYGWLDADRGSAAGEGPPLLEHQDERDSPRLDWDKIAALASNDFEDPVFRRHPGLRDARDALRSAGATLALLAGSGSTVFGIFTDRVSAERAVEALRTALPDHHVLLTATRSR